MKISIITHFTVDCIVNMCNILKICPEVSELCSVITELKCTEKDCNAILKSSSNLKMHYVKHHLKSTLPKQNLPEGTIMHYYCPEKSCIYNVSATKHFTHKRFLKQHYLKVHAEKLFKCTTCTKAFATHSQQISHAKVCGKIFKCTDCDWKYSSNEALLTHYRRKHHSKSAVNSNEVITADNVTKPVTNNIIILNIIPPSHLHLKDKEIQTELIDDLKTTNSKIRKRNTQHTQTSSYKRKKIRNNVETQTVKNTILEKAMYNANLYVVKSNVQTQSEHELDVNNERNDKPETHSSFSNLIQENDMDIKYFELDDNKESESENVLKDNLLSETIINNHSHTLCSIETQTDQFDLTLNDNMDSSFTQTGDLTFDQLLYSNTYTQTCDDFLLSELGFNNSHTQTCWQGYEDSVSTETQTNFTDHLLGDRSTQTNSVLSDNLLEPADYTQTFVNTNHGS